jgi:exopolyphosphatase/pppGpp-phosphohydrolase
VTCTNVRDRYLLEAAALLHEIGRSKGDRGHHKRTYKIIRKLNIPVGWSAEDLQAVAIIARYHRGALAPASNAIFAGIPAKRRAELLTLAGVLRLANAFDLTHEKTRASVSVDKRDGMLVISGPGFEEISPLAERLARARYLLEATCKIPIAVRPHALQKPVTASGRQSTRRLSVSAD